MLSRDIAPVEKAAIWCVRQAGAEHEDERGREAGMAICWRHGISSIEHGLMAYGRCMATDVMRKQHHSNRYAHAR